jgi:tetratricopeptide (TPR) repeat protein
MAAKAVYRAGLERLPNDADIAAAEAQAVERLQDWPTALDLWATLQERFPGNPVGYVALGRTLRDSGQLERSVEVLTDGLRRFPDNLELEIQLALTWGSTGEWQKAVEIWEALRQRYPRGHLMATRAYQMMEEARRDKPELFEIPQSETTDVLDLSGDTKTLAALLKRFESLGDDSEFGLVQRIFQADALGLLRWGRTLPDKLVSALDARFAGVGDPEHTIIPIQGNEYMTEDRRYSMLSHTFTPPSSAPIEEFSVEHCRRIQWLRQRLLDDLSAARKIFVYKTEVITDAELLAIYAALQRYSTDITLLFVRRQESGHPAGTVERVTGNLFVGYIDRFSTIDISLSIWIRLCQGVASELAAVS